MPAVENEEVRLHYELSGTGRNGVLVLSNSLGSDLHMWDKALPMLEREHRVLRYDTRGHGKSSVPPGPYTIDQLGRDVLFLLDSLDILCVNLCGLSLGGLTAMWLGIHAPQRLNRMILANTAARVGSPEIWDQRIATVQRAGMKSLAAISLTRWFTSSYREQHANEMEVAQEMIANTDASGYAACCGVLRDTDLRAEITAISLPCLVITGKHDPATPPADGYMLNGALRDSKYIELEASHLSAWERAKEFASEVLAFLRVGERCNG